MESVYSALSGLRGKGQSYFPGALPRANILNPFGVFSKNHSGKIRQNFPQKSFIFAEQLAPTNSILKLNFREFHFYAKSILPSNEMDDL